MGISVEEGKARRLAGAKREVSRMTAAQRVQRSLTTGRPPTSELKTPLGAVTAARLLQRDIEARLTAEGVPPKPGDCAVSVGYVTPDLSTAGLTPPLAPGGESLLLTMLDGNIMTGLIFGIVDSEADDETGRIVMGTRPFVATKQTDVWLSEVMFYARESLEFDDRVRTVRARS